MGLRYNINSKINEIEEKHGRITKSIFVISTWLLESKRFESMSRKFNNKDTLRYIWCHRNIAINEMLKTGLLNIKINKENQHAWLYVLEMEKEGLKFNLTVPYARYMNVVGIHHSELEESDCNEDKLYIDGVECRLGKRFQLGFIIENIDKSVKKLLEKIEEENAL